jgi:hypothetical protein
VALFGVDQDRLAFQILLAGPVRARYCMTEIPAQPGIPADFVTAPAVFEIAQSE